MPYNAIISRTDADGVIPTDVAGDVLKAAVQNSAALALSRRAAMSSKLQRQPVLSVLPTAYWVEGDSGLKMPSGAAFEGLELTAEEIAVLVPIPEAVLDDASYDIWNELRDPIAQAIGVKLDAAIFSGTEKPASWPEAIVPAAIAALNTNAADSTAAEGGIYTDILETGDDVEDDGYEVQGYVVKRALRSQLSRLASPWTRPGDPVFAATSGKPKGYRNLRRALETIADELEIDLVSHDFRRSLASFLIVAARADEAAVTAVMGHTNIETTRRIYAGDWREAEERNALLLRQLADAGIGQ